MEDLKEKKERELISAWQKICDWIKTNCECQFAGGLRLMCPHNPWCWTALVVNEQGDARIYHGEHGSDNPEYVATRDNIYRATNGRFQGFVKTMNSDNLTEEEIADRAISPTPLLVASRFEEIIVSWPTFKQRLQAEMKKNNYIANFEA